MHKPIISYIYVYKQFLFNFLGASTLTFTNLQFLSNNFFFGEINIHTKDREWGFNTKIHHNFF